MKLTKGETLTAKQIESVRSRFVHWPHSGQTFETWIKDHAFYVRKDGQLSDAHRHCEPAFLVAT